MKKREREGRQDEGEGRKERSYGRKYTCISKFRRSGEEGKMDVRDWNRMNREEIWSYRKEESEGKEDKVKERKSKEEHDRKEEK